MRKYRYVVKGVIPVVHDSSYPDTYIQGLVLELLKHMDNWLIYTDITLDGNKIEIHIDGKPVLRFIHTHLSRNWHQSRHGRYLPIHSRA